MNERVFEAYKEFFQERLHTLEGDTFTFKGQTFSAPEVGVETQKSWVKTFQASTGQKLCLKWPNRLRVAYSIQRNWDGKAKSKEIIRVDLKSFFRLVRCILAFKKSEIYPTPFKRRKVSAPRGSDKAQEPREVLSRIPAGQILNVLRCGSLGTVHRYRESGGRLTALQKVSIESGDNETKEAVHHKIRLWKELHHESIAPLLAFEMKESEAMCETELIQWSLQDLIKKSTTATLSASQLAETLTAFGDSKEPADKFSNMIVKKECQVEIKLQEVVLAAKQIAGALGYLHGQNPPLFHRGIKLDTILIRQTADGFTEALLADIGTANSGQPSDSVNDSKDYGWAEDVQALAGTMQAYLQCVTQMKESEAKLKEDFSIALNRCCLTDQKLRPKAKELIYSLECILKDFSDVKPESSAPTS
eukprot:CAMPEP_0114518206 /NCGR_PEP_ID=MMETSP0109-20121206/18315_1 /TAXON_ID=29199 /ORGANISM="Chlorarachnion reptans, Strain CCCM449" /LENGTH=417 /DNA_ID=CAMNT_0001698801 /DNA_START=71 /DNA_END=1324 /DNA_ORIENTATION=-